MLQVPDRSTPLVLRSLSGVPHSPRTAQITCVCHCGVAATSLPLCCALARTSLQHCRPSLSERDIPHWQTLRAEILRRAGIVEGRVCENLKNIPSKISFTFDAWTSAPGDPYLSLTAHYIAAPIDHPNAWELKTNQLLFQEIQGRHMGKNMGDILSRALERYDLRGKVRSFHIPLVFLLISTTGWMVYQRWCGCQLHHPLHAPEQPLDGYWMDSTRIRHAVSVHSSKTFCFNIGP